MIPADSIVIVLSNGMTTVVSPQDAEALGGSKVHYSPSARKGYAAIWRKGKSVRIHRWIMEAPAGLHVDHIDGNGLNNTRGNLRLATREENARNAAKHREGVSRFKGIYQHSSTLRWAARICMNGKYKSLGSYGTPEEAARAYDAAAIEHYGDFALTNKQMGLLT